uniref:Elongator complex protein 4 n=1 Tax=Cacopsylla melanoneura TaxID=428564 RepID=A0A8D8M5G9_9HEMI
MSAAPRFTSLPGTKVSAVRSLLLTSTGIITLDPIIGGGIPVGSILLLEEDEGSTYSKLMLKCFLSVGLSCGHPLFIATQKTAPQSVAKELMPSLEETNVPEHKLLPKDSQDELKIAWRYQNAPQLDSTRSSPSSFSQVFDLSQTVSEDTLGKADIKYFPECFDKDQFTYEDLFSAIQTVVLERHHVDHPKLKTVLKIGIQGLGSDLWQGDLVRFMYKLSNLIKSSYACVMITLSTSCLDPGTVSRCQHLADIVLRLDTLSPGDRDHYLNEYHGLFYISKQSSMNSLGVHIPDSNDWGFKLKRRRFIIEKLHLPPELQDSKQREQDDSIPRITCGGGGGGSGKSAALDF